MVKPHISVVIPARNEEKLIVKALQGLLVQTVKPNEVIIVDNASSDGTKKAALSFRDNFKKKNIKFRVVTESGVGSAYARNKGFYLAKSPFIASMDADVVPDRDWIQNIHKHFKKYSSVAVSGIVVMKDSSWVVRWVSEHNWYKYLTKMLFWLFGFQTITCANAALRKDVFLKISGFDVGRTSPDLLDDTELSSRLCKIGPIRIDTTIRVGGSFRRYKPFNKAVMSSIKRIKSWKEISKKYRENL